MKLSKVLLAMVILATFAFVSCKSKDSDADIKARVEEAIKADSTMMGTMVADVKDGAVTITGVCKEKYVSYRFALWNFSKIKFSFF